MIPSGRQALRWLGGGLSPWGRILIIAAALLLLPALREPLWSITLQAPQYPEGLRVLIHSDSVQGGREADLDNINILNHYVGMRPIAADEFPEFAVVPYAILGLAALALMAALTGWRWAAVAGYGGFLVFGAVMLADFFHWLYQYGHALDPRASIRLVPFMPPLIGSAKVANFTITSLPGAGALWMWVSAALGPLILAFEARRDRRALVRCAAGVAAMLVCAFPGTAVGAPGRGSGGEGWLEAAVARAKAGAVVTVPPGRHRVHLVIRAPITLQGAPQAVLDGGGTGTVITVRAGGAVVRDLTVTGSGASARSEDAAVLVDGASGVRIENLRIDAAHHGILLRRARRGLIERCTIRGPGDAVREGDRGDGIRLWGSRNNRILHNVIAGTRDGVYMSFSPDNEIDGNEASLLRYGLHFMSSDGNRFHGNNFHDDAAGAAVMYSRGLVIRGNRFTLNRDYRAYGLLLKQCDDSVIEGNTMAGNTTGLRLDESCRNRIAGNRIAGNDIGLHVYASSEDNALSGNAFVENLEQVRLSTGRDHNRWSAGGAGNFWSDAHPYDLNEDGRADEPYRISNAFGSLEEAYPPLRLFAGSPAALALAAAADRFPLTQAPTVLDPAPMLAEPPGAQKFGSAAPPPWGAPSGAWAGALVMLAAMGVMKWGCRCLRSA